MEKIRFSIKGPDGLYRGEVTGNELRGHEVYEVKLSTGDSFQVKAVPEPEAKTADGYKWIPITKDKIARLAPIVGTIIERYFRRKRANKPLVSIWLFNNPLCILQCFDLLGLQH